MAPASDWWQRALGQPSSPAPPPPGSTAAQPLSARPPGPAAQQPGYTSYDASTGAQVDDDGAIAALVAAAAATGGSRRVKEDSGYCPECGSGNYFARKYSETGTALRTQASSRCFDCGYPIIQSGSSHGGANSARREGPAQPARQLPAGHEITVLDGSRPVTYRSS